MSTRLALFGASAFAFLGAVGEVEAKKVHYEIDGQRYSYSTNNRQQTREAQARIAAARARAASTPRSLFGGFGSPAQPVETQTATGDTISETSTVGRRARAKASRAERRSKAREARAERLRERRQAAAARREASARERRARIEARGPERKAEAEREVVVATSVEAASPKPERAPPATEARGPEPAESKPARVAAAVPAITAPEPLATQSISVATVKTITFDLSSGIKTIQMTDGTLHEEPFESGTVAALGLTSPALERSLRSFVEQLRTSRREESPAAR